MDDHVKIVKRGEYGGYEYFITEVCNAWYCAYIILPEGHKYYGLKDYDSICKVTIFLDQEKQSVLHKQQFIFHKSLFEIGFSI